MAQKCAIETIEISLEPNADLAYGESTLRLRPDAVIAPAVLNSGSWQRSTIEKFEQHIPKGRRVTLVDVGANVGLISRQLSARNPAIERIFCYEPDPVNFRCLQHNLACIPIAVLANCALAEKSGHLEFFLDATNSGNYSLVASAMANHPHRMISVPSINTGEEFDRLLQVIDPGHCIVYKSDTQGYDEIIATQIHDQFWQRVEVAILELSRINRPVFDLERFQEIVSGFPNRCTVSQSRNLSVDEVMGMVSATADGGYDDLVLSR